MDAGHLRVARFTRAPKLKFHAYIGSRGRELGFTGLGGLERCGQFEMVAVLFQTEIILIRMFVIFTCESLQACKNWALPPPPPPHSMCARHGFLLLICCPTAVP